MVSRRKIFTPSSLVGGIYQASPTAVAVNCVRWRFVDCTGGVGVEIVAVLEDAELPTVFVAWI